jgi:hypothetical protein
MWGIRPGHHIQLVSEAYSHVRHAVSSLTLVHFGGNTFLQGCLDVQVLHGHTCMHEIGGTTSEPENDRIGIEPETFTLLVVALDDNEGLLSPSFVDNLDSVFVSV